MSLHSPPTLRTRGVRWHFSGVVLTSTLAAVDVFPLMSLFSAFLQASDWPARPYVCIATSSTSSHCMKHGAKTSAIAFLQPEPAHGQRKQVSTLRAPGGQVVNCSYWKLISMRLFRIACISKTWDSRFIFFERRKCEVRVFIISRRHDRSDFLCFALNLSCRGDQYTLVPQLELFFPVLFTLISSLCLYT